MNSQESELRATAKSLAETSEAFVMIAIVNGQCLSCIWIPEDMNVERMALAKGCLDLGLTPLSQKQI